MTSDKVSFFCLSSGSDSNCFYLGIKDYGILIDAGLGIRKTMQLLSDNGIFIESIKAIFITHDHIDHVRAVASLGEMRGIPIRATKQTIEGINNRNGIKPKLDSCVQYITKEVPVKLGLFEITAFDLPHDAVDPVGYRVRVVDKTFVFMTDLGCVPTTALQYIREATHLIIEANHDVEMLSHNPNYPEALKERILGNYGHLSNHQAAQCVAQNIGESISHIWLCHLSLENNSPQIAYDCVATAMSKAGYRVGNAVNIEVLTHGESSYLHLL